MSTDTDTQVLKDMLRRKRTKCAIPNKDFVSTGSTLLNLAASGQPYGGFAKGKYYFLVGDSTSGKTFLSLTCCAEAKRNPAFAKYRLLFDNVEDGALMDLERYFGKAVADAIELPGRDDEGVPCASKTVEDFYYNITKAIAKGVPFLYILDSADALDSDAATEKFNEQMEAHEKGKEVAGSYGDGKAKYHSQNMRRVLQGLRDTGSILIVLSQTRDNVTGMGFEKKTRAGGKALRFYATLEMWSSIKEKIKRTVRGKARTIGVVSEVKFKKNRFTGKDRDVTVDIYHSVGIDDVGSCIDYLIEEKHWNAKEGNIRAKEFQFEGTRDELIAHVEQNGLERDLSDIVGTVWQSIEDACVVERKARYA